MASHLRKDQDAHGGPVHANCPSEDLSTATTSSSLATSAAAAKSRGDVSPPPPPVSAYELLEEPVPAASGATEESSSAAPPLCTRSPAWFQSTDAAADRGSQWFPEAGVQKGARWSSASVHRKAFAGAALIPAPDAESSRPGTSGSTACSGGALSSLAEGGAHLSSPPPLQAQFRREIRKADASSSTGRYLLPAPVYQIIDQTESSCNEIAAHQKGKNVASSLSTESIRDEQGGWPQTRMTLSKIFNCSQNKIIDQAESRYSERAGASSLSTESSRDEQEGWPQTRKTLSKIFNCSKNKGESDHQVKKTSQGSKYWELNECPADVEGMNPPGFFSPHPVWEGFAIPVQQKGRKASFYCVACKKLASGNAAAARKHMLVSKGCLTSEEKKKDLKARIKEFEGIRDDLKRKRKDPNEGVPQVLALQPVKNAIPNNTKHCLEPEVSKNEDYELDKLSGTIDCASRYLPYPSWYGGPEGEGAKTPSSSDAAQTAAPYPSTGDVTRALIGVAASQGGQELDLDQVSSSDAFSHTFPADDYSWLDNSEDSPNGSPNVVGPKSS